jgi:hypothetical protein
MVVFHDERAHKVFAGEEKEYESVKHAVAECQRMAGEREGDFGE